MVSGTVWLGDPLGRLFYMLADDGDENISCFHTLIDGFLPITHWVWMHMGEIDQGTL